ncbi:hypothetical protein V5O48_007084 [Marasmius crinis-equi]|uniref:Uncharacterized protein n=1 Tax=Marasmius crinis-equi TaxID=585013 RepID=A0ABR3FHV0_9AGAR
MGFHLQFQGTGIAVYFIIANNEVHSNRLTECNFVLDGTFRAAYNHTPQTGTGTEYNVEVYKDEGLDNAGHILSVETGSKAYDIYIVFDYATYTYGNSTEVSDEKTPSASDGPEQTSTRPSNDTVKTSFSLLTGAMVGGVGGGVVHSGPCSSPETATKQDYT